MFISGDGMGTDMDSRTAFRLSAALIAIGMPVAVIGFFLEAYRVESTGIVFYAGIALSVVGAVISYLYTKDYFEDGEPGLCQTSENDDPEQDVGQTVDDVPGPEGEAKD